jgi:hypothetical protein
MTTLEPFNPEICPICNYAKGAGCTCEEAEPEPKLILLCPDVDPTPDENKQDFHTTGAYDDLPAEDQHYLESVIRLFMSGRDIDMDTLDWHLELRSLHRSMTALDAELDQKGGD